jgi:hypothetical protein
MYTEKFIARYGLYAILTDHGADKHCFNETATTKWLTKYFIRKGKK